MKKDMKENKAWKGRTVNVSERFVIILAVVSILGFLGIVFQTIFNIVLQEYIESSWLIIIGIGLIAEIKIGQLKLIKKTGLDSSNFADLITLIIGLVAIIAGILGLPFFGISNPGFDATKGIVSIIAIVIIVIQTWIAR